MIIEFDRTDAKNIEVVVNGDDYGQLTFDDEQSAWVLWPDSLDDGVTYTDDLIETKELIKNEIKDYKGEK